MEMIHFILYAIKERSSFNPHSKQWQYSLYSYQPKMSAHFYKSTEGWNWTHPIRPPFITEQRPGDVDRREGGHAGVSIIFTEITNRGCSRWSRFLSTHSDPSAPPCSCSPLASRAESLHLHSSPLLFFNKMGLILATRVMGFWIRRLLTVVQSKPSIDHSDIRKINSAARL